VFKSSPADDTHATIPAFTGKIVVALKTQSVAILHFMLRIADFPFDYQDS
jgi:hypothetical protein